MLVDGLNGAVSKEEIVALKFAHVTQPLITFAHRKMKLLSSNALVLQVQCLILHFAFTLRFI
jgi:hypothetical protein